MQKPWRSDACWLTPYGLLTYLSYTTQNQLPSSVHSRQGPPICHQLRKLNMGFPTCQWGSFLKWYSLSQNEFGLCEATIQLASTTLFIKIGKNLKYKFIILNLKFSY